MKPAFALDFRDETLSLLHRSGDGWQLVGAVPLDTTDLTEALGYLRSTAMALSPKGIATKLIVPNDQILYTRVHAPGPSDAERLAQVTLGLEGRTPYAVKDLAFDYSGDGPEVLVAVIAKETLGEAEAFANEYRFNPVSFVASPDAADFAGEPWFGLTSTAPTVLGSKKLERDAEPVHLVSRAGGSESPSENLADLLPATAEAADEPLAKPEVTAEPVTPVEPAVTEPTLPAEAEAEPELAAEPVSAKTQDPADEPAPDDAAPAPVHVAPPRAMAPAADDRTDSALVEHLQDALAQPIEQPVPAPPKPPAPKPPVIDAEEAPMALDVPTQDLQDDEPQGAGAVRAAISAQSARVTDVSIDDDVPPPLPNAAVVAFNTRRQDDPAAKTPTLGAAPAQRGSKASASVAAAKLSKPVKPTGLRGMSALVSSAAAAPRRQKVEMPKASINAAATLDVQQAHPTAPARKTLTKGPGGFALREPQKGKPRYLGLILTVVLLFLLAMIAAWSSYSLGAWNKGASDPTQTAALVTDVPEASDEMLADLQDPEALADGQTADPAPTGAAVEPLEIGPVEQAAIEPVAIEPAALEPAALEPAANAPKTETATSVVVQAGAAAADGTQDEIFLASMDAPPAAPDPLSLPLPEARGDPLPAAQPAPPPFGTVYQFEANGTIRPTPEGIITPEGVMLLAGKPPLVPAVRPAAVAQAAAALVAPSETAAEVTTTPDATAAPAPAVFADPALAGKTPKPRPATLVAPPAASEQGSLAPAADSRFASLRPKPRSPIALSAGESAREATAAATLSAQTAEPVALASASPLAVAISRKPAARPRDMSRAVEAAIAVAMTQPAPAPEPEPEPVAAKPAAKAAIVAKPAAPEDDGEPEVAASSQNKTPLKTTVAKQATFKNAINLSKINLIGVYGTKSNRYALVRQANGRYKKVRVGDSIDGGRVAAITSDEVRYQKGGRLVALAMPAS